jgi:hypothetical protein
MFTFPTEPPHPAPDECKIYMSYGFDVSTTILQWVGLVAFFVWIFGLGSMIWASGRYMKRVVRRIAEASSEEERRVIFREFGVVVKDGGVGEKKV